MSAFFDVVESVKEIDPRARVLFTSYKFNQDFFEKHIFSHFHGRSYPLLFIDATEYQEVGSLLQHSKYAGSRYFIESIYSQNTFHPKLIFALSEKKAHIFVGSNNLTWEGYTQSAEVITPIVVNFEEPERAYLLNDIGDFLQELLKLVESQKYQEHLKDIIDTIPRIDSTEERDAWLIHTINKVSLLDQITSIIHEPIQKISVISPYFAQERTFYQKVSDICPDIHLFIQQKTSNLPVEILKGFDSFTYHSVLVENNRFLHAKIIFFETELANYIFSGSANFSSSALITSANVEIGLLVKGNNHLREILKVIGSTQEITLEEVESQLVESTIVDNHSHTLKVIDAVLIGESISVTLDVLNPDLKYIVRLNGQEYSLPYNIDGSTLNFNLNDQILSLFHKSVIISIISQNGDIFHESNVRLVYNKKIFPLELDMLNYRSFDDANWLFSVLSKLLKLQDPTPYLNQLSALVDSEILVSDNKERMLAGSHFSVGTYNHNIMLIDLIDRCVARHQSRINGLDATLRADKFGIIVNSLILTNKLIIWAVSKGVKEYNELRHLKKNLDMFFEDKRVALINKTEGINGSYVTQLQLKYHIASQVFILDYLQIQSGELAPLPHLGYNPTKCIFEADSIAALSKAIQLDTNEFVESELSIVFDQYREIVPSLKKVSLIGVQIRLNNIIQEVNERKSKNYQFIDFIK